MTAAQAEATARALFRPRERFWLEASRAACSLDSQDVSQWRPAWEVRRWYGPRGDTHESLFEGSVFIDPWTGRVIRVECASSDLRTAWRWDGPRAKRVYAVASVVVAVALWGAVLRRRHGDKA